MPALLELLKVSLIRPIVTSKGWPSFTTKRSKTLVMAIINEAATPLPDTSPIAK